MIRIPTAVALLWLATGCSGPPSAPNLPPVAAFAASCVGAACSFTDASTDTDGRIASHRWSFGDGSAEDTAQDVRHAYSASGSYTVALRVSDEDSASAQADSVVRIVVRPNTPPVAGFAASCAGSSCTFTDSSTDADGLITSYRWSFGDGSPDATEREAYHTYATFGDYLVQLVVTDDGGGAASVTHLVRVLAPPNAPPQPAFAVACALLTCAFTDSSTDTDGIIVQWHWSFGDGAMADGPNPVHTYAAAGLYDVGLTVSDDGGLTGSTGRPVTVPSPTPVLGVSPSYLSFRMYAFRPDQPPSQQLTIANVGSGRLRWNARDNAYWLTLQRTQGTTPASVTVSVDRSAIPIGINGYRPGYLQASIVVSPVGAATTSVTVPVTIFISYQR